MHKTRTWRASVAGALMLASMLVSTSCAGSPQPRPEPLPIAWPSLSPPPPTGIDLAADGRVLVPLDYWLELVGYIRACDDVRRILEREGRLIAPKE